MIHRIEVKRQARIGTQGSLSENTKRIWIVLHGYGHLVPYFMRKFQELNEDSDYLIFPEGPHRYYLNGTSGRVGASWMTKEDRETDIADNHRYLDEVYQKFIPTDHAAKIVVIGFSQGGATVCRWVSQTMNRVDRLVLWASVYPPDLDMNISVHRLNQCLPILVVGDQDEFITMDRWNQEMDVWRKKGMEFQELHYSGTHTIDSLSLQKLSSLI